MGIIRKTISSMTTLVTGVPIVQFRSDTERGTHATNQLRRELNSAGDQSTGPFGLAKKKSTSLVNVDGGLPISELDTARTLTAPADLSAGWKIDPDDSASERFWSGDRWTDISRPLESN